MTAVLHNVRSLTAQGTTIVANDQGLGKQMPWPFALTRRDSLRFFALLSHPKGHCYETFVQRFKFRNGSSAKQVSTFGSQSLSNLWTEYFIQCVALQYIHFWKSLQCCPCKFIPNWSPLDVASYLNVSVNDHNRDVHGINKRNETVIFFQDAAEASKPIHTIVVWTGIYVSKRNNLA